MKFTFETDDSFVITSRKQEVMVDLTKLPASLFADLFLHGLTQKVADAASQAAKLAEADGETRTVEQITIDLMTKALDGLYAGEWTRRGTGDGVDERTAVQRSIARSAAKAKFGAKSPTWAKFTGMSDADQMKKLDEIYADNAAAMKPAVDEELARRESARKAKKGLAGSISIKL